MNLCSSKRVLIVKLGALGDVIFSTPLIRALKKNIPDSHITYLTTPWSKDIIEYNPYIDEVITFDKNKFSDVIRVLLTVRRKKFDVAFILHRNVFSGLFVMLSGIKERVGFCHKNNGFLLTKKVNFDANKHEVDRYLDLIISCGIESAGTDTEIKISDELKQQAKDLLLRHSVRENDLKIGVLVGGGNNPGTFMPIKRLENNKFAEISDYLIKKYNAKIIFIGDKNDIDVVNKVLELMKQKPVNLVGETTKKELLGILSNLNLFIGGDSGPLHIAASIGVVTVGIFGPSDPRLVAPRGNVHKYIWKHVHCSPCYNPVSVLGNNDFSFCPLGTLECMKSIAVTEVLDVVKQQLYARE